MIQQAWHRALADIIGPFLQRPKRQQIAALCMREDHDGKKVLLITSRGTKRWVLPKGWPMRGRENSEAAQIEAWEEAGVIISHVADQPLGSYEYHKTLKGGLPIPVQVAVYPMTVEKTEDNFPEAGERTRNWVSTKEAATLVQEPGLKRLLRDL